MATADTLNGATADALGGTTLLFGTVPPANYLPTMAQRRPKRQKTNSITSYSEAEQFLLQGAARILHCPLENLLACGHNNHELPTPTSPNGFVPKYSQPDPPTGWLPANPSHNVRASTEYNLTQTTPINTRYAHGFTRCKKRAYPDVGPDEDELPQFSNLSYNNAANSSLSSTSSQDWVGNLNLNSFSEVNHIDHGNGQDIYGMCFGTIEGNPLLSTSLSAFDSTATSHSSPSTNMHRPSYPTSEIPKRPDSVATVFSDSEKPDPNIISPNRDGVHVPEEWNLYLADTAARGPQHQADVPRRGRGAFKNPEQRKETCFTRGIGACISCSLKRIRCKPDPSNTTGPCLTCLKPSRPRLQQLSCLRYKIEDTLLLDHDTCPRPDWTLRWKSMDVVDIQDWASNTIKTIELTQDVAGQSYSLDVRRFNPQKTDALSRKWKTNGIEQSFRCEPYAIADMKEAGKTLQSFADRTLVSAIKVYTADSDALLRKTYQMAYRQAKRADNEEERFLLGAVFRLWAASRMESRSERICSRETLGMAAADYGDDCPNTGKVLAPPVMSAQIEVIMTATILEPARKDVLNRLKKLLEARRRGSWFTIYLAVFILLHNCALLTIADKKRALKQGLKDQFFRPKLIEGLHEGAKSLLAYFHIWNRSRHPFLVDWTSEAHIADAELNGEQAGFMLETVKFINQRGGPAKFSQDLRDQVELDSEFYFLAQLFDPNWKASHIP